MYACVYCICVCFSTNAGILFSTNAGVLSGFILYQICKLIVMQECSSLEYFHFLDMNYFGSFSHFYITLVPVVIQFCISVFLQISQKGNAVCAFHFVLHGLLLAVFADDFLELYLREDAYVMSVCA